MSESESKLKTKWNEQFEKVKDFAAINNRWPPTTSKDETEKALAQWWSRQKYLLAKKANGEKAPGVSPERETLLQGLIDLNDSFERDGVWETRYKLIVDKYKADRKLWPYASKNIEEQRAIRWWNQQKTFARKFKANPEESQGGMTQERFDKILALMRVMGYSIDDNAENQSANEIQSSNDITN
jgi:hypothetical protein